MFALVGFIFIALIVGTIAKSLVPGRDPGVGLTILLGAVAQIVVWFGGRSIGKATAQPWSFFLSIAAAAALLYAYREMGIEEMLRRDSEPHAADSEPPVADQAASPDRAPRTTTPLGWSIADALTWVAVGALMLGATGFAIGFFGPMVFQPWANQGPMVGIFVTGPAGVLLGAVLGGAMSIYGRDWRLSRYVWTLTAADVAYGMCVLELVADCKWWR